MQSLMRVEEFGDGTVGIVVAGIHGHDFPFSFSAGSAWAAKMLASVLRDRMRASVDETRLEAYALGWKDAKAKSKKAAKTGDLPYSLSVVR